MGHSVQTEGLLTMLENIKNPIGQFPTAALSWRPEEEDYEEL